MQFVGLCNRFYSWTLDNNKMMIDNDFLSKIYVSTRLSSNFCQSDCLIPQCESFQVFKLLLFEISDVSLSNIKQHTDVYNAVKG